MQIKSKLYLRIILLINYLTDENLSCSFTVFCQKKCHKKKTEREWHVDGLIPQVQVLSTFHPEVPWTNITLTLHNLLNLRWISLAQTVFLEYLILHALLHGVQTSWDGWNLLNKQFQSKSICFFSLLSRVNK